MKWTFLLAFLAVTVAGITGCKGGSSNSTTAPTTTPVAATTITLTTSGASPKDIVVSPGTQVTFINNDVRDHEMDSDPHPEHTDCPAINSVGLIVPGQSRQTGNLNTARVCGFHDHGNPENQLFRGTITIR